MNPTNISTEAPLPKSAAAPVVTNDLAEKLPAPEGKHGAEPGWLADDELTRDWLQFVEQYRAQCDATDRQRLLNDSAPGRRDWRL